MDAHPVTKAFICSFILYLHHALEFLSPRGKEIEESLWKNIAAGAVNSICGRQQKGVQHHQLEFDDHPTSFALSSVGGRRQISKPTLKGKSRRVLQEERKSFSLGKPALS